MKRLFLLFITLFLVTGYAFNLNAQASSSTTTYDKPTSGYDGGFFVQSKDGDFKMSIGARVDTMFYWISDNIPDDATTYLNEAADTLTFRLRRAQVWFSPKWKTLSAFVLLGGTAGTNGTFWFANGKWAALPELTVEWGAEDPGYDLLSITSSKRLTMADYPIVLTQKDGEQPVWGALDQGATIARPSFGLPTQLGIFLWGNLLNKKFQWAASVGNGSESLDSLNTNREFQYALRLSYIVLGEDPYGDLTDLAYSEIPSFAVGLGGAFEHDDATRTDAASPSGRIKTYDWALDGTADLVFKYRGFAANAIGYYRRIKVGPGATVEAGEKYLEDVGYLGTLAYFIIPKKFEVQAFASQIIREGPDNDVYEFGGGFNYYFKGHNAEFQIDYSRVIDYDDIAGDSNRARNRIRAKMQMYF